MVRCKLQILFHLVNDCKAFGIAISTISETTNVLLGDDVEVVNVSLKSDLWRRRPFLFNLHQFGGGSGSVVGVVGGASTSSAFDRSQMSYYTTSCNCKMPP